VSELFANAEDVDIHEIGKRVIALVEEMFVERCARNHFAPVESQEFEDGILPCR
jgi:hypothetical protein